jgi:hypothetical protein
MLAPRSCRVLPPPSTSLLPLTATASEPPEVEPPELELLELEPPELEPLELEPPELEPLELEPPELEPLELEPPELEPLELEPPELEPLELEPPELEPLELPASTVKSFHEKAAPPGVSTASCCAPSGASAGIVAVTSVALTTENFASWALPIHTAVAPSRAVPVMVSLDPMAPAPGEKLVIAGALGRTSATAVGRRLDGSLHFPSAHDAVCAGDPDADGSAEEQPRAAATATARRETGDAALK